MVKHGARDYGPVRMTRETFISLAKASIRSFDVADVDRPIEQTALDSLDLMTLRAALETHLGTPIRDDVWLSSGSLAELLSRLA